MTHLTFLTLNRSFSRWDNFVRQLWFVSSLRWFRESTAMVCCQAKHPTTILTFFPHWPRPMTLIPFLRYFWSYFGLPPGGIQSGLEKRLMYNYCGLLALSFVECLRAKGHCKTYSTYHGFVTQPCIQTTRNWSAQIEYTDIEKNELAEVNCHLVIFDVWSQLTMGSDKEDRSSVTGYFSYRVVEFFRSF